MKNLLSILLIVCLCTIKLSAQSDTISPNIFSMDGKLGIGIAMPQNALSIVGDETEWPGRVFLSINNTNTSGKSLAYMELKAGTSGNHLVLGHISETYTANSQPEDLQDFGLISGNGKGIMIGAFRNDLSAGVIKFCNGQNPDNSFIESMRISEEGNVGVGTSTPAAKLQVADGDIYISDINKGIIMKSPDGKCWRGVLNNNGQLVFNQVTCPGEVAPPEILIEHKATIEAIKVFPNPTDGEIYIDTENYSGSSPLNYELMSIDGKLLKKGQLDASISKIDASALPTGTYILSVKNLKGEIVNSKNISLE